MLPTPQANFRTPMESATLARVAWLIGMRWLFVLAILLGAFSGRLLIPDLPFKPFILLALGTALFNGLLQAVYVHLSGLSDPRKQPMVKGLIQIQVMTDWLVLLVLIHYTGGVESPLLHFFIFHLALSAVFLSPSFTVFALVFIAVATSLLFAAEASGLLQPVELAGLTLRAKQLSVPYLVNFCFWYFSTLAVMAMLLGSLMRGLRRREQEALRIRRRLEEANQNVNRISEERIRLMHVMGHELRSPLAAAQSMLSALELSQGKDLPQPVRTIHQRISQRLNGLIGLIGELLELAEQRRGPAAGQVRQVHLPGLLEGLQEEYADRAREKGLELKRTWTGEPDAWVSGDPERLRRIFENLLSNALKYSRPGGVVSLELELPSASPKEAAQVVIAVRDQGIGIAPDQVPRLFSEFYRTPQSRRHTTQGTGLGLAITRDMILAAGGRIEVQSVVDQGSVFRVWLPRAALAS